MKYVASYEKTIQVTEDSWRSVLRVMVADENTTIKEIREWYNKDIGAESGQFLPIPGITISEAL